MMHSGKTWGQVLADRVPIDQLRSDLDALLPEVDVGWQSLTNRQTQVGEGGCLLTEMGRMLQKNGDDYHVRSARMFAMVRALGFVYDGGTPHLGGMYAWNDSQCDPDAIKHRIKDAINNL